MNYKGKLYGRIGNNTYFDTAYTTDDWDAMEAKIKEIEKVKRKPLPGGTLPLTDEELEEFNELFYPNRHNLKILFRKGCVSLCFKSPFGDYLTHLWATNVSSILWLAERFDLTSNN